MPFFTIHDLRLTIAKPCVQQYTKPRPITLVTSISSQATTSLAYWRPSCGKYPEVLSGISEEKSRHRYAPGKWSIRQLLNHVNDTERIFLFRALWFARGFQDPLPGYDQDVCAEASGADDVSWVNHTDEFRSVRLASLALFQNLPEEAWLHNGSANGSPISVRAIAYIIAGHVQHHTTVLKERYL